MVTALNTKNTGLTRQFAGSKFEPSREQAFLLYADSPAGNGKLISQREPISPEAGANQSLRSNSERRSKVPETTRRIQ